jgi:hypothetical protein
LPSAPSCPASPSLRFELSGSRIAGARIAQISRQAFIWPCDSSARLTGAHLYEDKTGLRIVEVDPDEAITPARVREIHRELLARLEAERGPHYWVLDKGDV